MMALGGKTPALRVKEGIKHGLEINRKMKYTSRYLLPPLNH